MNRPGEPDTNRGTMPAERARAPYARWLALTACLIFTAARLPATAGIEPQDRQPLKTVFEIERPPQHELLVLTSGEQLSGTVLNTSFKFQTVWGELQLPKKLVAGVDFGTEPGGLAVLISVNNNRLAGFLKDSSVTLKLATGAEQKIRREKIARILFRLREDELAGIPQGACIFLKNGDRISGQCTLESLPLRTANGTTSTKVGELLLLSNTNAPEPTLLVLREGQHLRGTLAVDDLPFELDIGQKVSLYQDLIAFFGPAYLNASPETASATETPESRDPLPAGPTNIEGMVWIPAGQFVMGSPKEELGRDADEGPQTKVAFPRGFWLGKYEVTQAEFQRVMGFNPSTSAGDPRRPVEKVSWFEAVDYCRKLTEMAEKNQTLPAGYIYRLPTEAEWEYACRAGTTTRFFYGDDTTGVQLPNYAWFTRNSDSATHPVGARKPNRWGLHDMHGNVWEWCFDRWEDGLPGGSITNRPIAARGNLRVARGGSWLYEPKACRSGNRDDYSPWDKCSDVGFRVTLAPLPSADE
jgi:formylglycine-generating enzyme required for sulfatase activity